MSEDNKKISFLEPSLGGVGKTDKKHISPSIEGEEMLLVCEAETDKDVKEEDDEL